MGRGDGSRRRGEACVRLGFNAQCVHEPATGSDCHNNVGGSVIHRHLLSQMP